MRWAWKAVLLGAAGLVIVSQTLSVVYWGAPLAHASAQCSIVDMSPHNVSNGSQSGFSVIVTDSTDALSWINVVAPSQNIILIDGASSWLPNVTTSSSNVSFSGNPINPGNNIEVDFDAIVSSIPPSSWTIQASTSQDGSNPFTCSGDTSISVTDTTPPQITNLSASASTTAATVTWTTDKNTTSELDYGTTTTYDGQVLDSTYVTSHNLNATGLTPATLYHYQVVSVDQNNNSASSSDGTFLTASLPPPPPPPPPTPVPSNNNGNSGNSNNPAPTTLQPLNTKVTAPSDKIPPTINLSTTLPRIITKEPTISGKASDDMNVAKVEYSVDGGKNWLSVDTSTGLGTKQVTFSFTPLNLDDQAYDFVARAVDGGGNITTTSALHSILDRSPPIVGGTVISLGAQVLLPDSNGVLTTTPGVDLSIHTSTTGGATSVNIMAIDVNSTTRAAQATFALQRDQSSGLWNGGLSFTKPGAYNLLVHSIDGAGNTTDRTLGQILVRAASTVLSANGPVAKTHITVYYRDPDTNSWAIWDGEPYGEHNPQTTDKIGAFRFILPPGTYYVRADAPGYQSVNTASFTVTKPSPLVATLHLQTAPTFGGIQLPIFNVALQSLASPVSETLTGKLFSTKSLVNTVLGNLTLTDTTGTTQHSADWLGKPTLLTISSTWAPLTEEQLVSLEHLNANTDINVRQVGLLENAARLEAYNAIAGSSVPWLADTTGQTVNALNASTIPANYFVDRKGIIRSIVYGVMTYDQMVQTITNLP